MEKVGFVPFGRGYGGLRGHRMGLLLSTREMTVRDGNHFHALEELYGFRFRHPFYDRELVEYVLSLPPEFIYSRGWTKLLLRYGLEGILPDPIRSRRDKAEFSPLIRRELEAWFHQNGPACCPKLEELALVPEEKIREMSQAFLRGEDRELMALWRMVNLECWYGIQSTEDERFSGASAV
jgi:asparagine synthase (glutamine-hydrolysing)